MDLLDYSAKGLGAISTLIVILLSYLQIRELIRKRSLRSDITMRGGQIVEHKISSFHQWQIWLAAASFLVGLILIGKGIYEDYNLLLIFGFPFILAGSALTYAISRSRLDAQEKRMTWYEQNKASFQRKKKVKRSRSRQDKKVSE